MIDQKQLKALKKEKSLILKWLSDNDWKVNKIFLGEWDENDSRSFEYLNERQQMRNRFDEIETAINDML